MLIKILSRHTNSAQLVKYALRYVTKEKTSVRKDDMIILAKHHLRNNSVEGLIAEFKENEKFRLTKRKNSVAIYHSILSFHKNNRNDITLSMLKNITKHYITLRAPNCLNLAVAHFEKQHIHCHILTSGTQINGKSARISKEQFMLLMAAMESYQQVHYPQLEQSKIDHKRTKDKQTLIKSFSSNRKSISHSIQAIISQSHQQAHSHSDFVEVLHKTGHDLYYRNGIPQGVLVNNKKFRLTILGFDPVQLLAELDEKESHNKEIFEMQMLRNKNLKEKGVTEKQKPVVENAANTRIQAMEFDEKERGSPVFGTSVYPSDMTDVNIDE